jgi:hypothetical protein
MKARFEKYGGGSGRNSGGWAALACLAILLLLLAVPASAGVSPASRYVATQITDKDVVLQDPQIQVLIQKDNRWAREWRLGISSADAGRRFVLPDADGGRRFVLPDADGGRRFVLPDADGGRRFVLPDADGGRRFVLPDADGGRRFVLPDADGG